MEKYKVVGPCEVAGVAPGGTVTREQLESFGRVEGEHEPHIHVGALVGFHLEPVDDVPAAKTAKAVKDA